MEVHLLSGRVGVVEKLDFLVTLIKIPFTRR